MTQRAAAGAALAALLLLAVVVVRTAWVSDDAYITFRTVDNLLHGLGATWNPDARVQAYTHPLWMLLLAAATPLAGGPYAAALALSLPCALGAAALIAFLAPAGPAAGALGVVVLASSKAFTDFATSGLETPLTYLLLAAFLLRFLRARPGGRDLLALALLAGLGMVNRLDTALLFLPPLALAAYTQAPALGRWRTLGLLAAGLSPVAAWEAFSLLYYGALFPNTAYAKLGTGIPAADLARQGVRYLADSLRRDPLTLAAVAAGLCVPLLRRDRKGAAVALGILLHLAYVVKIGGDFMSGRFLAAPLVAAAVLLATAPLTARVRALAALGVLAAGLLPAGAPLLSGAGYADREVVNGIADERGYYFQDLGLLRARRGPPQGFDLDWAERFRALADEGRTFLVVPDRATTFRMLQVSRPGPGRGVVVHSRMGVFGYHVGPRVHVVDVLALSDPFLARLPAKEAGRGEWRIGHFDRVVPKGYPESILFDEDRLADPGYAALYADLRLATRGSLLAPGRAGAIWRLNTGAYAGLRGPGPDGLQKPPG